jgi:hypothetical protein
MKHWTAILAVSATITAMPAAVHCAPAVGASAPPQLRNLYFRIQVVDDQTSRGVPLVELRTVSNLRYVTDSNGVVAFYEPGLMDRTVFFHVSSHGYEFPKDGFGYRGAKLLTKPGGSATLKIKRINLAERLYRVIGEGLYRDSVMLGEPVPIKEPLLNAQVTGSDSVVNTVYRGRVYWFWGDTNWPTYPLGNFHVPGATSALPKDGGLDPQVGVDLTYFTRPDGFAKETCRMRGDGPTWIDALTTLRDESGRERLFAAFVKPDQQMKARRRGLAEWNDEKQAFEEIAEIPLDAPVRPSGHPLKWVENGTEYVYFATPFPLCRVPATVKAFTDLSAYESYTCLKEGTRPDQGEIDRNPDGSARYAWKRNTPPWSASDTWSQETENKLLKAGRLKPPDCLLQLKDADTGEAVNAHGGSVYWNEFRRRWIMITVQSFGKPSFLGEVWYAEADTPVGPWVHARKVVTHDKMSFYNPKQHPMFDKDGGRTIFFEGTYVNTFSNNPDETPLYNYNQVMYKLDLTDPRLSLPAPGQ